MLLSIEVPIVLLVLVLICLGSLRLLWCNPTGIEDFTVTVNLCELEILPVKGEQINIFIVLVVIGTFLGNIVIRVQRNPIVATANFFAALWPLLPALAPLETHVLLIMHLELSFVRDAATVDTDEPFPANWVIHHVCVQLLLNQSCLWVVRFCHLLHE